MIPIEERLRQILWERNISILKFCQDTGIFRGFFYRPKHKHHRAYYMACAYYLKMTVEELIEGTDAMEDWYG